MRQRPHHVLENRRVVRALIPSPAAVGRAGSELGRQRVARVGEQESEIAKKRFPAVQHPSQYGPVPGCREAADPEAECKQGHRLVVRCVGQAKGDIPRDVDQGHRADVDGVPVTQCRQDVVSMCLAPGNRPAGCRPQPVEPN